MIEALVVSHRGRDPHWTHYAGVRGRNEMRFANKIIRRPDFAGGGITDDERAKMAERVKLWKPRGAEAPRLKWSRESLQEQDVRPAHPRQLVAAIISPFRLARMRP